MKKQLNAAVECQSELSTNFFDKPLVVEVPAENLVDYFLCEGCMRYKLRRKGLLFRNICNKCIKSL